MKDGRSHVPEVYIEVEVRDRSGKLVKKYRQPAKSWVRNFMTILYVALSYTSMNGTKQDGSSAYISINWNLSDTLRVNAPAGDDNYGILVGSGTKAFDINDYSLDNKIPHGTGSGQLLYGEVTIESIVDDGEKLYLRIIRVFSNNSGGSITVAEVGLASYSSNTYLLIARDVLPTAISVPNGSTLTVRYIIQYQYS